MFILLKVYYYTYCIKTAVLLIFKLNFIIIVNAKKRLSEK